MSAHAFDRKLVLRLRNRCGVRVLAALSLVISGSHIGLANPQGGVVKRGDVTISDSADVTTIQQRSNKAIIDWRSFSVGENESVVFLQPGSNAIVLNRVTGNDPSNILGTVRAQGQVWLVNPHGVLFGDKAKVDVHSLIATTADVPDEKFGDSQHYEFSLASSNPAASVVNEGTITFGERGLALLVAPNVRNDGVIQGKLGTVIVAGAPTFAIDLQGDRLINFAMRSEVVAAAPDGHALVENTGSIHNDGGTVLLTADAAAGIVDEAINISGVIEARGVETNGGAILLVSDGSGQLTITGELDAGPSATGTRAGTITMHAEDVILASEARVAQAAGLDLSADQSMTIDANLTAENEISLTAATLTISETVSAGGKVRLRGTDVATTGDGKVEAGRLDVASTAAADHPLGGGTLTLNAEARELAIGMTRGSKHFREASITADGDLHVAAIDSRGIDVGSVILQVDGTLSLDQPIKASAPGDAVVIVAGRFINTVDEDALQTTAGRALVYSVDPRLDNRGNIDARFVFGSNFEQAPPASISLPGDVFIYQHDPNPPVPPPPPLDLDDEEIDEVTQPTVIPPVGDVEVQVSQVEAQLVRLPPAAASQNSSGTEDLLFANDGNRELWGLTGDK